MKKFLALVLAVSMLLALAAARLRRAIRSRTSCRNAA